MPNIKSAKKRVLVNEAKRQRNKSAMSEVRTAVKKFNAALDTNNVEEAERLLPATMSILDSAASAGLIHKNNAANKKSGLAKRLSDVKSGKIVIEVKKDNKTIAAQKAMAAKEAREAVRAENAKKAAEKAALKEDKGGKGKAAAKPATKAKAEKSEKPAKAEKAEKPAKETKKAAKTEDGEPKKKAPAKKAAKSDEE